MGKLYEAVREYLTIRRQLGFNLRNVEATLNSFVSFLKRKNADRITTQLALEFVTANPKASSSWQASKLGVIRRFASYLHAFDIRVEVPSTELLPFSYHRRPPYIFTDSDIVNLLEIFQRNMTRKSIDAQTYYALFGLIAVSGMRTGEALALKDNSVDLKQGIITIYESKFRKSRKLPIHRSAIETLKHYCRCRNKHLGKKKSEYFFVNNRGNKLNNTIVQDTFKKACIKAEIGREAKFCPRITDLRHYFAIKTLVNCYKKKINPETVIPTLSMYLGHENPKHTYWYLTATEELMAFVGKCVEEKFGGKV
jgi:integrase/recombinase XerD